MSNLNFAGIIASIVGAILGLGGLIYAIKAWREAEKAKDAANASKKASEDATASINKNFAISDLSSAIFLIEEIKRLNRMKKWEILVERYGNLIKLLSAIKAQHPDISNSEKRRIQNAITQIRLIEEKVDDSLCRGVNIDDQSAEFNKVLSPIFDDLNEIINRLKTTI